MDLLHTQGFGIEKPLELLNWRIFIIPSDMPFENQESCAACGRGLESLARLSTADNFISVDLGLCPRCGYIQRPPRQWLSHYYREDWSAASGKEVESLRQKQPKDNSPTRALDQALELLTDRSRPVVEIGCGYGTTLKHVKVRGFSRALGIESSHHRAHTASRITGLPILTGDFESRAIQEELERAAPVALFLLFHVLEHTYNPADIIAQISHLQDPDDLCLLSVPRFSTEPAMNILLFLPHLHSFTPQAIATLLANHGYEIIDSSFSDQTNITVIARKTSQPQPATASIASPFFTTALHKFKKNSLVTSSNLTVSSATSGPKTTMPYPALNPTAGTGESKTASASAG